MPARMSPTSGSLWQRWKLRVILLPLMLCVTGCSMLSRPSIVQQPTPLGNSYRLLLPKGTVLVLPTQPSADQVRAVAINEVSASGRDIVLTAPLQLVSPAYIAERDAADLRLEQTIAALQAAK